MAIYGNVTFNNNSFNKGDTVGTITLNNVSTNYGVLSGSSYFNDTTFNRGVVSGVAYLEEGVTNLGRIQLSAGPTTYPHFEVIDNKMTRTVSQGSAPEYFSGYLSTGVYDVGVKKSNFFYYTYQEGSLYNGSFFDPPEITTAEDTGLYYLYNMQGSAILCNGFLDWTTNQSHKYGHFLNGSLQGQLSSLDNNGYPDGYNIHINDSLMYHDVLSNYPNHNNQVFTGFLSSGMYKDGFIDTGSPNFITDVPILMSAADTGLYYIFSGGSFVELCSGYIASDTNVGKFYGYFNNGSLVGQLSVVPYQIHIENNTNILYYHTLTSAELFTGILSSICYANGIQDQSFTTTHPISTQELSNGNTVYRLFTNGLGTIESGPYSNFYFTSSGTIDSTFTTTTAINNNLSVTIPLLTKEMTAVNDELYLSTEFAVYANYIGGSAVIPVGPHLNNYFYSSGIKHLFYTTPVGDLPIQPLGYSEGVSAGCFYYEGEAIKASGAYSNYYYTASGLIDTAFTSTVPIIAKGGYTLAADTYYTYYNGVATIVNQGPYTNYYFNDNGGIDTGAVIHEPIQAIDPAPQGVYGTGVIPQVTISNNNTITYRYYTNGLAYTPSGPYTNYYFNLAGTGTIDTTHTDTNPTFTNNRKNADAPNYMLCKYLNGVAVPYTGTYMDVEYENGYQATPM